MADDGSNPLQDAVKNVVQSVAQLHAIKEQQSGQPQQPAPTMMNQQSALVGQPPQPQAPPQQPQPALGSAPPSPLGAPQGPPTPPSNMGQRGQLPPGITMQTQADGHHSYNGVFPQPGPGLGDQPTGQVTAPPQPQQPVGDAGAANGQMAQLPPVPTPPKPATQQDALKFMAAHGINTGTPAALHYAPEIMKTIDDHQAKVYKAGIDAAEKVSLFNQHIAATQKAQADAQLASKRAQLTGSKEDITRAKDLAKVAQDYMTLHPSEAAKGGFLGIGKADASPGYAGAQKDVDAYTDKLRGGASPASDDSEEDDFSAKYDAMPSGTVFTGPDGKQRKKP